MAILLLLVCINGRSPFFDEQLYLRDVEVLHRYGWGKEFLLRLTGSAGPLYAVIHHILEPFTRLRPPYIRLVNIFFLAGTLILLARTLSLIGFSGRSYSLYLLAIPMTYVTAGLALTEMPAIFFLSAGIYLVLRAIAVPSGVYLQVICLALGGICMGIAICGRQPYLVLLAALPVLFSGGRFETNTWKLLLLLVFSLILPASVFYIWGGLVPPADALFYHGIEKGGILYRPDFFLICLAYYAIVFLIIAPGFYLKPGRKMKLMLWVSYILMTALNWKFPWITFMPLHSFAEKIFTLPQVYTSASIFLGAALAWIGCYFLLNLLIQLHRKGYQKYLLFFSIGLILIAVSCSKITWGFSSRYAAQAIPLLVLSGSYFRKESVLANVLLVSGVVIGLVSLISYVIDI